MELHEQVQRVNSRETFLSFVSALRADWQASRVEESDRPTSPYSPGARGWANPHLGNYLEAMHSWTEDMGERIAEPPSWRTFADILYAAKIYE
ncbi:MAG TPA: hypothetical protein VF614_04160 [Chthoniobacteraceae bacterium]|jgi:hypothetical protein